MTVRHRPIRAATRSIWNYTRFQLGIGLLVAVLLPWATRVHLKIEELDWPGLQNSLGGTGIATVAGYFAFRRLSRYPGVRASYPIIPTFAVSYSLVLMAFFFARLDYSRLQFLASFLLCVLWYYAVYFKLQRQPLRIGVLPFGEIRGLTAIDTVSWIDLSVDEAAAGELDIIVADFHADLNDDWERFLADRALAGTLVMHVKQIEESLTGRVAIEHLSENNFGSLIPGIIYARVKRTIDILIVLLSFPFLLVFLSILALLIVLDSRGPVFFYQQRMGFRGRSFKMVKLRTMVAADEPDYDEREQARTLEDDRRITRIGRFLRRYRLDELPQAINVLKGEMSWIGPRPEALPLSAWYEAELPFYRYRHIVRPGITGWAQVKQGHVSEVDQVLGKLHYDFYYIKNFSFWLDLLIMAGTVRTVITGHGAR